MLHVTNGDSAVDALRAAGIEGEILPWRDVLHEGPVPATGSVDELSEVRARFLAASGWTSVDQALAELRERDRVFGNALGSDQPVVLWFEHDLYDQLQLLDALRRVPPGAEERVELVSLDSHLTSLAAEDLRGAFELRSALHSETREAAAGAWDAFSGGDPSDWDRAAAAAGEGTRTASQQLPYLGAAWSRLCEELPAAGDGLSRCERQLLEALAPGGVSLVEAFRLGQRQEEAAFLGDSVFAEQAGRLSGGPHPLLVGEDGGAVIPPRGAETDTWRRFWQQTPSLTESGREVLAGAADSVRLRGIDRWLGGTRLTGEPVDWRWNRRLRRVERGTG